MPPQTTLAGSFSLRGRGVHTGRECLLTVRPAAPDRGIRFARTDRPERPEIPARWDAFATDPAHRRTILEQGAGSVCTIEHVVAALAGMGVDNADVDMDAPEAPILDGSAGPIAQEIARVGVVSLPGHKREILRIGGVVHFSPTGAPECGFVAWPSETLTLTYFLEQDYPSIGSQAATFRLTPEVFAREIAPARTFCTEEEIRPLQEQGLIRGGSLECTIVFGPEGPKNTALRWDNEPARHKLLDLLGDLRLLGRPLHGHILARRTGHRANRLFVEFLGKEYFRA